MIKILFYNKDGAGVNYYRTKTPAMQLERAHSDEFHVEINQEINFNDPKTIDYLKSFHIIHYHRQLHPDINMMIKLAKELKDAGVKLVIDIDDYWELDKTHPYYKTSKENGLEFLIKDNLKIADYVTTTTELFADEIRKVTGKDNVHVFYNSINPDWMKQFKSKPIERKDDKVTITYMAGSSHMNDVQQLTSVANYLNADPQTKGKFKFIVAGWDTNGKTTDVEFNNDFRLKLEELKIWNKKTIKIINNTKGDVDQIPDLPNEFKDLFRGKVFFENERPINSNESVYLQYENILTDNLKIVDDSEYIQWLNKYERASYPNEGVYGRRWTEKVDRYAKVLDESDIVLAPLADTKFNKMKSNLKQVECWTRKLPIVCSDIAPYDVHGVNNENCILIPVKKNAHKYWKKALKKLILDSDLRKKLGEQLYEDYKELYHLGEVTKKRAKFYNNIAKELLEI